jgi:iron complex transport system substrate-binding protein
MTSMLGRFLLLGLLFSVLRVEAADQSAQLVISKMVSLAPHLTELAFVAGAGDRIVGTVEYSDHPAAARAIPRVGNAFLLDYERLLALSPDVVLAWDTGTPKQTIERLRELGLRVEVFSTPRIQDVAAELRRLGRLAGTERVAEQAAQRYEEEVKTLRAEHRGRSTISVFVQINDRPLYTVNRQQIISEILALCGGKNVFANLNELAPAIGEEAVIAANPDAIISTDDSVPDPLSRWRKWSSMKAIQANNVFSLPSDDLTRPTTRLVEGARATCKALDTARAHLQGLTPQP